MVSAEAEFVGQLRALLRTHEERIAQAEEIYAALKATKRLTKQRALAYYCRNRRRCLLLDVVPVPSGYLLHIPRFKLSPKVNLEFSNEDGRRANTEDGNRHWRGRSLYVDQVTDLLKLTCDHVHTHIAVADILADLERRATEVRIPR